MGFEKLFCALLILPLFCILTSILFTKWISSKNIRGVALIILFVVCLMYVGVEQYKIWRDYGSDYTTYCDKIKETITNEPGVILADNLYWFCFPEGNLRDIIIPQVWLHNKEGMSSQEILTFQNISYVIIDPTLSTALYKNTAVFEVPDDYVRTIEACQKIGEVTDNYYTSPSIERTTIIYKC